MAGTYPGHPLDPKPTLLQSASSEAVEGVKLEFHGQIYKDQQQSAIIELSCDSSVDVSFLISLDLINGRLASHIFGHLMRVSYE